MSHNVSVATVTSQDTTSSGRTPEDYVENTTSSSGNIASQADYYEVKKKLEEREKLKEELLRQYEAGHLKTQMCSLGAVSSTVPTLLSGNTNHPRQIPTIEEHRAASTSTMVRRTVSLPRPLHLPDVSRPPPGYNFPLTAVTQPVPTSTPVPSVPLFQPTPTPTPYTYEDSIVTRVLQTILNGSKPQSVADLPSQQTPCVVDKVLNWDTGGGMDTRKNQIISPPILSGSDRSRSRQRDYQPRRRCSRSPTNFSDRFNNKPHYNPRSRTRTRSRSLDRRRSPSPLGDRNPGFHDRYHSSPRTRTYRSPSFTGHVSRYDPDHMHVSRRDISPRTRRYGYYSPCTTRYYSPRDSYRRQGGNYSPRPRSEDHHRDHREDKRQYSDHRNTPKKRRNDDISPRSRKIVLLSPQRSGKSIRDKILDERDSRGSVSSPVKKRVKDRLGVRKEMTTEVFNMDNNIGRCGAVAIIKEYIDDKNGLMELRTTEGGHGSVILFNENQVWVTDRKVDSNGIPSLFVDKCQDWNLNLQTLFPIGMEVLINARRVRSDLVELQATVVWPKYTEIPNYKLKPSKLNEDLDNFHQDCRIDKLVPICLNGLPPVGSLNIWSARIKQIVNEDFGIIEVTSDPRDGKKEFCHRFACFFHKSDLWLEDGVNVEQSDFYYQKPLSELVSPLQPVDLVARSIIREKGQFMKKCTSSTMEMQALSVSLKTSRIPKGAPRGSRVEGGPGAFGGCPRGETPYMFRLGLTTKLNMMLNKFIEVYNKPCTNLDPELLAKCPPVSHPEKPRKKVHKITMDEENNFVKKTPVLAELVTNIQAIVKETPDKDGFGLLQSCSRDWLCLFQVKDFVLCQSQDDIKVGTRVLINANLVDPNLKIQYIASCIWKKSESSLELPNIINKKMITSIKMDKFFRFNMKLESSHKMRSCPRHLELERGNIFKILDDNFGIIDHDGKYVLFDTCDLWIQTDTTAAKSTLKLQEVVSMGDKVCFHAALINVASAVPYLATSVWKYDSPVFSDQTNPAILHRDQIHPDKIKIYQTVTSCSTVTEDLALNILKCKRRNIDNQLKSKLNNVIGIVKIGIKLHKCAPLAAGIVQVHLSEEKKIIAFFLSSQCLETHEKFPVCVPGTRLTFNALPISSDFCPVTHVVTVISAIHQDLPVCQDPAKIMSMSLDILTKIKKYYNLKDFAKPEFAVSSFSILRKSNFVVDSFPTGRLVCMINEKCGILEDQNRELAYFEVSDTNLPSSLTVKDVVMVMSRCRDVAIRFQASPALESPVKMIVHDGTIAISSNLDKYHPEVKLKNPQVIMKPNAFSPDKLMRANEAIDQFKADKILTIGYILESPEYQSVLMKSRKYGYFISESENESSKQSESEPRVPGSNIQSLTNIPGKLKSILNENFGLIEFKLSSGKETYCLFDTYDLYLESSKTAAKKKVTIDQIFSNGSDLMFNACEICPASCVPWLANGVWRPDLENPPEPVPYDDISKEKLAVFEKVADTCSLMLPSLESNEENCSQDQANDDGNDEVKLKRELLIKDEVDLCSPANAEEIARKCSEDFGFSGNLRNDDDGEFDEVLEEEVSNVQVFVPNPSNPDSAILNFMVDGVQISSLAHSSRIWLCSRPLQADLDDWDTLRKAKSIRIKASKVSGFNSFKYQIQFAHVPKSAEDKDVDDVSNDSNCQNVLKFQSSIAKDVRLLESQLHEIQNYVK